MAAWRLGLRSTLSPEHDDTATELHRFGRVTTEDLALHGKLDGLLALPGTSEDTVAWVVGMTPEVMWQLTDRPSGMTSILWRRLAYLHGIDNELLVAGSTTDALTAARDAFPARCSPSSSAASSTATSCAAISAATCNKGV